MDIIERLVAKVKEFKKHSEKVAEQNKDINKNSIVEKPSEELIKLMGESAKIAQDLFELIDELEAIEGKVKGDS